jgi:putative ABC transport system permease protein
MSSEPVAMVDEALAREYFPDADPIGQRIVVGEPTDTNSWRTIVGIIGNEKRSPSYRQIGWVERPTVLKPLMQDPPRFASVVTRGASEDLQRAVAAIDNTVAVGATEIMEKRLERFFAYPGFRALLLSAFAVFSVLLAAIGLYGVLSQFVIQRTQEIGLRMAVGARSTDVLRMVAVQIGAPLLLGVAVGLTGAFTLGQSIASLLYGIGGTDPSTLVMTGLALICAAAVAAIVPAQRALRVDPIVALRNE